MTDIVVMGQVARDLVLRVGEWPDAGGATPATQRRELLGGKGANQAVGLAQLGVPVALVGVVGDDDPGTAVREQAAADGIDVSCVLTRTGVPTALLLDLVAGGGERRLVEHVPPGTLLTPDDVAHAHDVIAGCQLLSLQLQQPGPAVRAALGRVAPGAVVVCDGAPADDETRAAVLGRADVLRADATEAAQLVGRELPGVEETRAAAAELLTAGPRLVALSVGADGDLLAWRAGPPLGGAADEQEADPRWADDDVVIPLLGDDPVDPTGAGDAFVAALAATLLGGAGPEEAAWAAAAAAALTVGHAGGRPTLEPAALGELVRRAAPARRPG